MWSPRGFDAFRARFPKTPALLLPARATSERFITRWEALADRGARRAALWERRDAIVVLVRGFLGRYMPGNFVSAWRALGRAGIDALIAPTRPGGTVADNVRRLARAVDRLPRDRGLVFAGHSKGGIEALALMIARPDLAARTRRRLMSQTPHGASRVLESVLLGWHEDTLGPRRKLAEAAQRAGLAVLGAGRAGRELTGERLPAILAPLDRALATLPFPIVQTASWSSRPTTWLDSFHERLGEIAPGVAHDGQFLLADLIWPAPIEHVLLPHLDHAQPVMDGFGFDSARYWETLVAGW